MTGRRPDARRLALLVALLTPWAQVACEPEEVTAGPPRCEPAEELLIERHLKEGFRALADGDAERASAAFEQVVALDADHPEARAGLRAAAEGGPTRREASSALTGADARAQRGRILVAGERIEVPVAVNTERYRFEEERARREVARSLGQEVPLTGDTWFRERTLADGAVVPVGDPEAVVGAIDLIVLHDTRTLTARESFVGLSLGGGSTHFTIDYDGTVYQNLDLAWEANHTKVTETDRRSVSIDLVNPVDLASPPLPGDAPSGLERPLSEFTVVQETERQSWGYTPEQLRSLSALLRGLTRALPQVPPKLPRDADGQVPRRALVGQARAALTGVVGHLHLSRIADDPGAGFPWSQLDALR